MRSAGAEARVDYCSVCGTTEVVPFQNTFGLGQFPAPSFIQSGSIHGGLIHGLADHCVEKNASMKR
jgi:hypothetical protein